MTDIEYDTDLVDKFMSSVFKIYDNLISHDF